MIEKKKILVLGKLPPPDFGPAIATEIILNSSLKNQFKLIHLNTTINRSLTGIGVWGIKKIFKYIFLYFRMIFLVTKNRPHLVLIPISQSTTGFIKDFFFILIAKAFQRKILLHLRGGDFKNWLNRSSHFVRNFIKYVIHSTNGVIVLGNNLTFLFEDILPKEKIFVSPNGANYSFTIFEKEGNKINILYFGNLQASKGIEDLLEAVQILYEKQIDKFVLSVVGNWRDEKTKSRCIQLVEKNKLPVIFLSSDSGMRKLKYFTDADIFVFTPRAPEGHPWVIVEAMARGLPIISTNRGAIVESVHNGVNGFIVGVQKPEEIAEKLELIINDKELRGRMGAESRKIYEEKFTEEKMVGRLTSIFNQVINHF